MEADGRWSADWTAALNDDTRAWFEAAAADFFRCLFLVRGVEGSKEIAGKQEDGPDTGPSVKSIPIDGKVIDFGGFKFPGDADFRGAAFSGRADFMSTFTSVANFMRAAFSGDAHFGRAAFGKAIFGYATFSNSAYFGSATFSGNAHFGSAAFSGCARFEGAAFSHAHFGGAIFSGHARFEGAAFSGGAAFRSAAFHNSTSFRKATFHKEAGFSGIMVDRAFDLTGAVFSEVPAFNQADFKQAPDLDDVRFPRPRFWRAGKQELVAQYRAIRRMAIHGADYEREQMAFKGELRSRRWTVDKVWHPGLWLGLLYDGIADCGHSIWRPAGVWLASIMAFAAFYWQKAAAETAERCKEAGGPVLQALYLSVKNALVVFGGTRDARVNQAYLCLYNGKTVDQPNIPPAVTFVETLAQIPLSATLIFLFLLAVKNQFKIK